MPDDDGVRRPSGIVADGRSRLRKSPTYKQAAREIRRRYKAQYRANRYDVSRLGRVRLRFQLWRQMRRELDTLAPKRALYSVWGRAK